MIMIIDAIKELGGKSVSVVDNSLDEIYWNRGNPLNITKKQIKEKYDELVAEFNKTEPIRLLRVERDKKLQESDWRTNNDYPYDDADAWTTYRTQLRNLPAEISAGNVTAPILQNGTLSKKHNYRIVPSGTDTRNYHVLRN